VYKKLNLYLKKYKQKNFRFPMKKIITLTLAAVTIVLMSFDIMQPTGIEGYTGSQGESTCVKCHSSSPLNSGGGSVKISCPTLTNWSYIPGEAYTISVTVAKTGAKKFGFGFEALTSTNTNAGTLIAGTGTKTATFATNSRINIVHTGSGNAATDTYTFTFTWHAPATDIGKVTFYCAGNAANGSGVTGDYIYTASQVITSPSTVGIAEKIAFSKQISIYPNPATDQLQILNTANPSEAMNVSIIDLKGALISTRENVRSNEAIQVSNLKAGMYSLKIETAGKVAVKPFVKQ
jgi:hypothetical protein